MNLFHLLEMLVLSKLLDAKNDPQGGPSAAATAVEIEAANHAVVQLSGKKKTPDVSAKRKRVCAYRTSDTEHPPPVGNVDVWKAVRNWIRNGDGGSLCLTGPVGSCKSTGVLHHLQCASIEAVVVDSSDMWQMESYVKASDRQGLERRTMLFIDDIDIAEVSTLRRVVQLLATRSTRIVVSMTDAHCVELRDIRSSCLHLTLSKITTREMIDWHMKSSSECADRMQLFHACNKAAVVADGDIRQFKIQMDFLGTDRKDVVATHPYEHVRKICNGASTTTENVERILHHNYLSLFAHDDSLEIVKVSEAFSYHDLAGRQTYNLSDYFLSRSVRPPRVHPLTFPPKTRRVRTLNDPL